MIRGGDTDKYVEIVGTQISGAQLRLPIAKSLFDLLTMASPYPFAKLVECRAEEPDAAKPHMPYRERVVFDVDVEVPQYPVHPIKTKERIGVLVVDHEALPPEAVCLREDFPADIPHLNIRPVAHPPSLCLSDQPWEEDRIRWTARRCVESIRQWLALTAEGRLHQDDQPLEPLLRGVEIAIVLPQDVLSGSNELKPLHCVAPDGWESGEVRVVLAKPETPAEKGQISHVAIPIGTTRPVTHGVIRWEPGNLQKLQEFLEPVGIDLIAQLKHRLREWVKEPDLLSRVPIFIVAIPKRRVDEGPIESLDVWAFSANCKLEEVGERIGVLQRHGDAYGTLLSLPNVVDEPTSAENVQVSLMRPYIEFNRDTARISNGLSESDDVDLRVVAIGQGALGSQVIETLLRSGYGRWVLVDNDALLPHNLARHALGKETVGFPKSSALAHRMNHLLGDESTATSIVTNILHPKENKVNLRKALHEAKLVLDLSASIAVGRHLARDVDELTSARRISAFLTPSGSDLIVLAEDGARHCRLDALEMQYYRAVASMPELQGHLSSESGVQRYGRSCRDLSRIMSEELVQAHAAIASRAIRSAVATPEISSIRIWRSAADLSISAVTIPVHTSFDLPMPSGWTLCYDAYLLEKIAHLRSEKLPNETGGVLVGSVDTQRRIVYVVDTLPSPPDSRESSTGYYRGSVGLRDEIERISTATAGWLEYIGEWHSHPSGHSAQYSNDDKVLFTWLGKHLAAEDHPPIMLIMGEDYRWYVESLTSPGEAV